jgi:hypothetical protein
MINSKTIPYLAIICGILGLVLRLWIVGDGEDAFGLYPSNPLGWGLLWTLTGALAAMIIFACLPLKTAGSYEENYPKSLTGMLGCMVAGLSILISGIWQLGSDALPQNPVLDMLVNLGSLAAGVILIYLGVLRFLGKKPNFLLHGALCLFFALRVFHHCIIWSNEPQIGTIVLPFLASLALMLACYRRTCFDVDLGNRRQSLLWNLLGTYLCIVAVFSFEDMIFYGTCALWLMTDLCSLRPIRRKKPQPAPREPEVQTPVPESTAAPEDPSLEELKSWLENLE